MKKFYTLILTAGFLLTSFLSQGQTFNSIADGNPNNYTLDDPRFWVGGVPPPSPCGGCTIKIFSNVTMVHSGGFTTSTDNVFTTQVPASPLFNDGQAITRGMKFRSTIASNVTGVRFYKIAGMGGVHTGLLYNNAGTLLASVVFTGETATGWQDMKFAVPVAIAANTTFTIAVLSADGNYIADHNFFAAAVVNGVLTGLADGTDGVNGVFALGGSANFPTNGNAMSNYWVDLDFSVDGGFLNDIILNNSTVNVYGTTSLNISTYLQLFNSNITIGNDPTSAETIFVNDQVQLNGTSSIVLANNFTTVNANNDIGNTVVGPLLLGGAIAGIPGIYSVRPAGLPSPGSTDYTLNTLTNNNYNSTYVLPMYTLNCTSACASGLVFGPAKTVFDATLGTAPAQGFIGFEESTTLPVVLVQFIANKNDDGTVKVSWATSQEQNSNYYDVERSSDQTAWAKIGTVKAKGYASTTTNYSLTDDLPVKGTGYYRLKMVDLDGKYTYSRTIAVTADNSNTPLVIYNNPFIDQIRLKVNVARAQNLTMTVTDMLGQIYISQSYQAQSGDNYINLLPGAGGNGMYVLHIHGDGYDQTVKLEKQQ